MTEEDIAALESALAAAREEIKALTKARDQYKKGFEAQSSAHAKAAQSVSDLNATILRMRNGNMEPVGATPVR